MNQGKESVMVKIEGEGERRKGREGGTNRTRTEEVEL
jgi:hypothetical protein